ncbi:glycerol-3-phosphate phosphatase-like [Xenia sp. Carnegie-2017]|uniref:glycerol-3-phosphate phosphatase-like n=1 Tax=Xenia sp. Carnegie-2017 TaxID=2897299 RepID=UPI001F04D08B|nr:glycerol-3-phosphate phosphatase-like [Xenia sp. Carnegie-2017]
MTSFPVLLNKENIGEFLASNDTFMFDCDGVLWKQNNIVHYVPELIKHLRQLGKRVFFISNNNTKSRRQYLEKFSRLEIEAKEDEIYPSSYAAAYYIKYVAKLCGKVYVLGAPGLVEELVNENIKHIGSGPDEMKGYDIDLVGSYDLDPEVSCVLHGFDAYYSYNKLHKAINYLLKDCVHFVATNKDMIFPTDNGFVAPGTGCLVTATEISAKRKATVVGKPETLLMECIKHKHDIDPEKTCMIGDNLDTDILFGNRCNTTTLLVLTGVSTLDDVQREQENCQFKNMKLPHFYIKSATHLYDLIK